MRETQELKITCPVCGEKLERIDREHAVKHGYASLRKFKEAEGIEYATVYHRSRDKFRYLYNIDFSRWALTYATSTGEYRYVTKTYTAEYDRAKSIGLKSATRFPLGDTQFNRHFTGVNPLAVFAYKSHSRFFGFDVDTKELALHHTLKLIHALKSEGIPAEDIHVSYSGGKGYHIELFIDKHIQFAHWIAFGSYIVDSAGLIGEAIEFRPNKTNGHAWKLPLTYHHKTGNFAAYCDVNTLDKLDGQSSHDYLFTIKQMDIGVILPILSRARQAEGEISRREDELRAQKMAEARRKSEAVKITDTRIFRTPDEKKTSAITYLNHGLVEQGTRWKVMPDIALYLYHENGVEPDTIREILITWTEVQIQSGLALTPLDECTREIDKLLEWVETTDGFYSTVRDVSITRAEVERVTSIVNQSARSLFWALLLRAKAYAKNDGSFYTSDRDLQKLLKEPRPMRRVTISKWRRWLVTHGYIEAHVPEGKSGYKQRKATTYRLLIEEDGTPEIIDSVTFSEDMDCRVLLRQIASKLYEDSDLKRMKLA